MINMTMNKPGEGMTFTKIPTNCHWCGELRLLTVFDDSNPVRREWICVECRQRADEPLDPDTEDDLSH